MPTVLDQLQSIIEPLLASHGLELFDLDYAGGRVIVTVDRPGGPDVGDITDATKTISRTLDGHDVVPGHYTLEVSSPGLERPLRTPAHYTWAVTRSVKLKLIPTVDGDRRLAGTLTDFDADAATITNVLDEPAGERRTVALIDIDKARTVFVWGAAPKPESPSKANKNPKPAAVVSKVEPANDQPLPANTASPVPPPADTDPDATPEKRVPA